MIFQKKYSLFIIVLLLAFVGLSPCYGYDGCEDEGSCGFEPGMMPTCYEVTFEGVLDCNENMGCVAGECDSNCVGEPNETWNDTHHLVWSYNCIWVQTEPHVFLEITDSNTTLGAWGGYAFGNTGGRVTEGAIGNQNKLDQCCIVVPQFCYGGSGTITPIYDCNEVCEVNVSDYKDPLYAANKDCCPSAERGEFDSVTLSCDDATSVVPSYNIEGMSEIVGSVEVSCTSNSASFTIRTGSGPTGASATVTCKAIFVGSNNTRTEGSATVSVEVKKPGLDDCCKSDPAGGGEDGGGDDRGSCGREGCRGGGPPVPSSGNSRTPVKPGTNPATDFLPRVEVSAAKRIDVRLPASSQFYTLSTPLGFMPGWSAEETDSNTVTVQSPDGLKYIYTEELDYKLAAIKNADDANVVIYDYNDTDPNLIDKQIDGFDSNLYIEYGYDVNGLLKTLEAWDYNDVREYTLTYDANSRVIAVSNSCESCGGSFEYEYDANDLLIKLKDASDPNIVLYEYVYDSNDRITDKFLGETEDSNHFREFIYTYIDESSYIVDTRSYIDVNTYGVTREYMNSAGSVTKRIAYESFNEDPDNVVGDSFVEHIVYYYDANNAVVKKVVIPPSVGDPNAPDPNAISGIRKEYTYDPNTGRMLTEKWFDGRNWGLTVSDNTYEYILDPCDSIFDVRVLSSKDVRGGITSYSYDGNSVVPDLRTLPEVNDISGPLQLKYDYTYDSRNRVILEELLDDSNDVIAKTKYVYGDYGNLTKRHEYSNPASGDSNEVTEYEYNGYNEMTRMTLPSGIVRGWSYNDGGMLEYEVLYDKDDANYVYSKTWYSYDDKGRTKKMAKARFDSRFPVDSEPNDTDWVWTEYEYDLWGRRTKVIEDANGLGLETIYKYNNQRQVIQVTLPNGKWTRTYRDGRGLLDYIEVGHGSTTVATTDFDYDKNGNLEEKMKPDGTKTRYEYDDFDRVTKVRRGL